MKSHLEMEIIGNTIDDAAGEAFDKCGKLMDLSYPAGPMIDRLASQGNRKAFSFAKPKVKDLDFSFSGLKTAVLTLARRQAAAGALDGAGKADIAREFQHAVVDVLVAKSLAALGVARRERLVVAGGVGANRELRSRLTAAVARRGGRVFYPDLAFCTDNGAMIALVGALRMAHGASADHAFSVKPRWELDSLAAP